MAFGDSDAVREIYEQQRKILRERYEVAAARYERSGEFLSMAEQAYTLDKREVDKARNELGDLEADMEREFGDQT